MAQENETTQAQSNEGKKSFFQDPKKVRIISIIVGVIVLGGLGYLGYYQFMWKPKNEESKTASWKAFTYFEKDSTLS